jgi:hypothetical protein
MQRKMTTYSSLPLSLSQTFLKKERNTMSNATAAISPIKIASVFSTSSFPLLSTAERKHKPSN